ncbi:hypothetical protein CHS0354_022789 [Potamilus streckersoni]|uniref:HIT-type domain-containing protein n=1 Tax=Potamilus streckersoni TaxID=2493646 RepID=A0AAE0VMW0_9BIVA|nr:hypothetical protein CHS0354_022789 [Potamilus streckersoni]
MLRIMAKVDDEVLIHAEPDDTNAEISASGKGRVCCFCLNRPPKYTCPRCNQAYCSSDCYKSKKHLSCSESFYKDCFMECLADCRASSGDKKKMMEMLNRVNEETAVDFDDKYENEDLEERIKELDLDKDADKIWNILTEKEKQEFTSMVREGCLGSMIEVWIPWWENKKNLFVEEGKPNQEEATHPEIKGSIPALSELLPKSKPSSDIKYNVINLLYGYAFICRLHNGEHCETAVESCHELLDLSAALGPGQACASTGEAVQMCLDNLFQKQDYDRSNVSELSISVIKDVIAIIRYKTLDNPLCGLMAALTEVLHILKVAMRIMSKDCKQKINQASKSKESRCEFEWDIKLLKRKCFQAEKKVEFFLSWAQIYGLCLDGLVLELELQHSARYSEKESVNQSRNKLEKTWGGKVKPKEKVLIEEIS